MVGRFSRGARHAALAAVLLALAGCLEGPSAPTLRIEEGPAFGVAVQMDGERLTWRTSGAATPLLRIDVLLEASGNQSVMQAWRTITDPDHAGSVDLRLPPGTWAVRAKAVDGTGRQATSPALRVEVATPVARPLPALQVDAPAVLADADGNGSEPILLVGRVALGSGQALRGATWTQDGQTVAQGLSATVWRLVGRHAFTLEVAYSDGDAHATQHAQAAVQVNANRAPAATADATPDRWDGDGDGVELVRLRANASDPDGLAVGKRWRSGGITLVAGADGNVSAGVGTHVYTFEATDEGGARTVIERRVTVHPNRSPSVSAGPDVVADDPEGDGATVSLAGVAVDPDGLPVTVRWRRAQGTQDLATSAQATLHLPRGTHLLHLAARDAAGAEASDEVAVVVRAPLPPIAATLGAACDLDRCEFSAAGSTGQQPLAYRWSLGDGTEATTPTVSHAYGANGRFTVRLDILDGAGRTATAWTNVTTSLTWNVFEDGAESDAGWTQHSWYHARGFAPQPPDLGVANHPNGTWAPTTAQARTGARSWTAPYPDQINASMTSTPIRVPDDPARPHALTYWLRGGVENNPGLGVDGLRIYVRLADGTLREEQYVTDDYPAWRLFTIPLDEYAGQVVRFVFSFQSDGYCSQGNGAQGRSLVFACDPSSYEGYFVDDIAVA